MANAIEIFISASKKYPRGWRITAPWLKLSLKYGLEKDGPWSTDNRSVAFDRYALSRGPKSGPPSTADLAITTLMNSNVVGKDLASADYWLQGDANRAEIENVTRLLCACNGLDDAPDHTLDCLGNLLDRIEELPNIKTAKVAKWFSAWAPSHVPMIDDLLLDALGGSPQTKWRELLRSFQTILIPHVADLTMLGNKMASRLGFPKPITPVRVLDSLMWFDWSLERYQIDFAKWITPEERDNSYVLTKTGQSIEAEFGMN